MIQLFWTKKCKKKTHTISRDEIIQAVKKNSSPNEKFSTEELQEIDTTLKMANRE